jgi:hypothetical protein
MPLFSASSIADLLTPERNAGRVARAVEYVVFVECRDGSWCELDADSEEHCRVLSRNWVDRLEARGCSAWRVRLIDGSITPKAVCTYYWEPSYDEAI